MMSNVLGVVSKKLQGAIVCVKIDADKYPSLAARYGVQALPTCILFKASPTQLILPAVRPHLDDLLSDIVAPSAWMTNFIGSATLLACQIDIVHVY